jgi:DNA polymerase III psi subunit
MLDSLSVSQKIAYFALDLGPFWQSREQPPAAESEPVSAVLQKVPLALIFDEQAAKNSDAHRQLLGQLLRSVKLTSEHAQFFEIASMGESSAYEIVLVFGARTEFDSAISAKAMTVDFRIDLPSIAAIASDGKAKAAAWQSLKQFALSNAVLNR